MKIISILFIAIFSLNIFAGEFSKIDQTVRETIIDSYNKDWEGDIIYDIDYDNDIWNIHIVKNNTEHCLLEVSAFANLPAYWGSATYQVWVCINKLPNGEYEGEVYDRDQL